ncbi:protein of unknown function (DUF4769) [Popillia japonica]|uniref:Uncharacterized protein n=1 Tax=Popillia japonica TaxID=7064 RepID=A0AAW1KL24_POPJA
MCVINGTNKYFPGDYNVLGQTTDIVRTANREVQPTAIGLEEEILQRFPSEKLEFYRVSKRGKIYNKSFNLRSSFKAAITLSCATHQNEAKRKQMSIRKRFW